MRLTQRRSRVLESPVKLHGGKLFVYSGNSGGNTKIKGLTVFCKSLFLFGSGG